ncbi:MAG: hypothetical protein FJZ08_00580 [Candidatus Omnitrophica bacterium]|nr:hypothetical protein [Candidatus Omnitrophota bacterium]
MGKKELKRHSLFFSVSCCLLILLNGCQTVRGAVGGAAEGAKRDWRDAKEADQRLREVLW